MVVTLTLFKKGAEAYSNSLYHWFDSARCSPPAPHFVKLACLLRHSLRGATWVETGTYLGKGASFLSEIADHVHTIEPSEECFSKAKLVLQDLENVTMHKGFSEDIFPRLLSTLTGRVCFWLMVTSVAKSHKIFT